MPPEDYQALINQGVKPEDIILNLNDDTDAESDASISDHNLSITGEFAFPDETTTAKLLAVNSATKNLKRQTSSSSSSFSIVLGCGNVYAEELPTTSANVQQRFQENHQQQQHYQFMCASGKPTEMTNCLDYSNQHIVKTICTNHSHSKDLNALDADTKVEPIFPSTVAIGFDNSNNISNNNINSNVGGSGNGAAGEGGGVSGYSTSLFYGTNVHKGVIVSPSMLAKMEINTNQMMAQQQNVVEATTTSSIAVCNEVIAGVEDVAALSAITSNETKKARRVQKPTRCSNSSGKRSK